MLAAEPERMTPGSGATSTVPCALPTVLGIEQAPGLSHGVVDMYYGVSDEAMAGADLSLRDIFEALAGVDAMNPVTI